MSRRLTFYYDTLLEFEQPVVRHAFALRCVPLSFPGQKILDVTLTLDPWATCSWQQDGFGNLLQIGCVEQAHTRFRYTVQGSAEVDFSLRIPEKAHPVFRFPSAYTEASPEMLEWLTGLQLPRDECDRALSLSHAIHSYMTYTPGVTGVNTTAREAFAQKAGVCQDYAHVYLAMARQAGLTARYVNGLPEGEGASHAWCEVWLNGMWVGVDPTRNQLADEGYLRLGVGRDFWDCPVERGIFLGCTAQRQTVTTRVYHQQ
jgi:transglutaminase-like putative cysteine protease